jgi:hypothetical protein
MKTYLVSALAATLAVAQFAAMPVYAAQPAAQFRTATPHAFTSADLQRYGMSKADADRSIAYQNQGYKIAVLTPQEAEHYKAGLSNKQWLWLGIAAGVIIIAVAVSN